MKLIIRGFLYMKKLNNDLIKKNLFIKAEEVYGKDLIDKFRQKIYDIGWAIISDEYLVNKSDDLDYIEE